MTEMLEKAARAVKDEIDRQDDVGTFQPDLIARAVLMAVREPDGGLADVLYESERDGVGLWTDGIDAILAQEPGA